MTKSTDTPLGHTISHTDTAQGKGGGRLTEDATSNPGGAAAGQGNKENAKNRDAIDPDGKLSGTTAQEEADGQGTGGKDGTGKTG